MLILTNAIHGQSVNILIQESAVKNKIICHLTKHANHLLSEALPKALNKSLKECALQAPPFPGTLGAEAGSASASRRRKAAGRARGAPRPGSLTVTALTGRAAAGGDGSRGAGGGTGRSAERRRSPRSRLRRGLP